MLYRRALKDLAYGWAVFAALEIDFDDSSMKSAAFKLQYLDVEDRWNYGSLYRRALKGFAYW